MRVNLFTTCNIRGGRVSDLKKLLSSINDSIKTDPMLTVRHFILIQGCNALPDDLLEYERPDCYFLMIEDLVSLSGARNILLKQAYAKFNDFGDDDIFAFPDDDAWYPPGLLSWLVKQFSGAQNLNLFVCRYGSDPVDLFSKNQEALFGRNLNSYLALYLRTASSNTIFIRASLALKTGFFDERLGVGAKINGGEDLDYALRAYVLRDGDVSISTEKLVGHRDWTAQFRAKYYVGSLFAIARSAPSSFGLLVQLLRKMLVGFYFVIRREMTISQYFRSMRVGLGGFGEKRVLVSEAGS